MAVEETPRLGLTRWTADTDEFNRTQMTLSHDRIDEFVAKLTSGTALPSVTEDVYNSYYFRTTDQKLFFCDSVTDSWREITLDPTIRQSVLTTKGDIIARNASAPTKVAVGNNGQFLSANSATDSGLQWIDGVTPTGAETLTNKTLVSPAINSATLNRPIFNAPFEVWFASTSPISTSGSTVVTLNLITAGSSSFLYTGEATNTWVPNVRGDGSNSLNNLLAVGQSVTVSVAAKINTSAAFSSSLQIDGSPNTILWQGGLTPSSGNAGSTDVYTYAIVKTASSTYTVFASRTRFG